jgi:predicted ferric reductase
MSSFLALSRRAATTSIRNSAPTIAARPFSIASSKQASGETAGKIKDSDHTTRKDDRLDVQTDNSVSARE